MTRLLPGLQVYTPAAVNAISILRSARQSGKSAIMARYSHKILNFNYYSRMVLGDYYQVVIDSGWTENGEVKLGITPPGQTPCLAVTVAASSMLVRLVYDGSWKVANTVGIFGKLVVGKHADQSNRLMRLVILCANRAVRRFINGAGGEHSFVISAFTNGVNAIDLAIENYYGPKNFPEIDVFHPCSLVASAKSDSGVPEAYRPTERSSRANGPPDRPWISKKWTERQ